MEYIYVGVGGMKNKEFSQPKLIVTLNHPSQSLKDRVLFNVLLPKNKGKNGTAWSE